jgi:hypothetical protein
MRDNHNAIPELVSLETWLRPAKGKRLALHASLRAEPAEVEIEGVNIRVSLKEAILDVALDGLEHAPRPRLGEPVAEKKVLGSRTVEHRLVAGASIDAGADSQGLLPFMKAGVKSAISSTLKDKINTEDVHLPVRAIPNDRWRITEPRGEDLESTFLESHKALCELDSIKGGNRQASICHIAARQRDITVTAVHMIDKISTTKSRLADIVLKKTLHDPNTGPFRGMITFCASEVEVEKDEI